MNFNYEKNENYDNFADVMGEVDEWRRDVPQYQIFIRDYDGDLCDYPLWSCDINRLEEDDNLRTISNYVDGRETENWIDDNEGDWESISLYFYNSNGDGEFEFICELVDLNEVREQRKKCAMEYLRRVLPKYIRHHLYKPNGVMAKKAKKDFKNRCN